MTGIRARWAAGMKAGGIAILLAACASAGGHRGGSGPAPGAHGVAGAGRLFTPADDGVNAWLAVGDTARLIVPDPSASDPDVEGEAIELVEVINIAASGRREWEIHARRPGMAVIRSHQTPRYAIGIEVVP